MQIFERIEKKYRLTDRQYESFMQGIKPYMKPDEHGFTTICNIYFDTANDDLIKTSLEKPIYKEKIRMRSYGIAKPDSTLYLELKKKYKGVVYKRRMALTYQEATQFIQTQILPNKEGQIQKELQYSTQYYQLKPKCFLAYDRKAYYGKMDHNLRITIDYNIRSRFQDFHFESSEGEYLTEKKEYLVELKTTGGAPLWLVTLLNELQIYPCSFSKYGHVYEKERRKHNVNQYFSSKCTEFAPNRGDDLYPNLTPLRLYHCHYSYENQ